MYTNSGVQRSMLNKRGEKKVEKKVRENKFYLVTRKY